MKVKIKHNGLDYVFEDKKDWDMFWKLLEQKNSIKISMGAYRE